jgi:hypothetical protein
MSVFIAGRYFASASVVREPVDVSSPYLEVMCFAFSPVEIADKVLKQS